MENFNEFDNLVTTPQKDSSNVLAHAFGIYKKGIGYAVLLIVLTYIGSYILSLLAQLITGFDALEMQAEMRSNPGGSLSIFSLPGASPFIGLLTLLGLVLYPLNAGFLYICNKINFNEKIEISDLFIGYKQNTAQIILFGFLTSIIMLSFLLCFLPGLFLVPMFFLGLPYVFFENKTAVEGLTKSFELAKQNYWPIWVIAVLSALISIAGVILCGIGILLTISFVYAGMYSAYCAYSGAPRPTVISK